MPRDLDPTFGTELVSPFIRPAFFAELTFRSQTSYVWTGVGPYSFNGQTWTGVGDVGSVGTYSEGMDLVASGMTISLSGINNTLLGESMSDIRQGAPAVIYLALLDQNMNMVGVPTVWFGGLMDKPTANIGTDTSTITIALETNAIRLQQGQRLKYTSAEQRRLFPDDTGFDWVEKLNDQAIKLA